MKMLQPDRIFIIAEAGVNHNGSLAMAMELVDAAADAGADAVKFQTFKAENLVVPDARKAVYQQQTTGADESQFAMLKRLELSREDHHSLAAHCQQVGIRFLSTAFDPDSLAFLVNELGMEILKIASGEITNAPLLLAHARTGCDLIVSTGMATLDEVKNALAVIAWGLIHGDEEILPDSAAMEKLADSAQARELLREKVILLHCTTEYPAPIREINLQAMVTMGRSCGLPVGYSDHSAGIVVPIAAAALNARIIEKHFTLDKNLPGPDHQASLDRDELKEMVAAVRAVELAMGDGVKQPAPSELANRSLVRKSLVAATDIRKGELFSRDNVTVKRPGTGMSPFLYWQLLGRTAGRDYRADQEITE